MKLWLLLVSLLVSDLSPLGDRDCIMDYYRRNLCRQLLLDEQMASKGLETLLTQTKHHWMCFQRNCVYVAVRHKQRKANFYRGKPVHKNQGGYLTHQALTGIIHSSPTVIVLCLQKDGESFPEFLTSDTLPAIAFISGDTSIEMDMGIKDWPDSQSVWLVHHHHCAAHNFLLEKSKSWATASIAQWQKRLTKRNCAAAIVSVSCYLNEGEIRSAMNIKKIPRQQIVEPQMRQKENTQVRDIKYVLQEDGQHFSTAIVNLHDILQAAILQTGSSSDLSKLHVQRNAAVIRKNNEHTTLDEEPTLQERLQKQLSSKAASRVDDGFYINRQLLLVSREKKESIKRLQHNLRAAQKNNKNFNGKIITPQAELQPPEGESEVEGSHTNTIENGNQEKSANIVQSDFTEEIEEGLTLLLLPDTQMETQTEPASARTLILNADTGWKTVNIPIIELGEPPPIKQNFIRKPDNSKCIVLEMYAIERTEGRNIKPAESTVKTSTVSAYTEEQVKETTEKTEYTETMYTPPENMSINHTKQEENIPSEETAIPSPPSNKIMETEMMKTEHITETTTVNMEIKETTSSMEVFNQSSTWKTDALPSTAETSTGTVAPEPSTDSEPRCIKCKMRKTESRTGKLFAGLRMREDNLADIMNLHKSEVNNAAVTPTHKPVNRRNKGQNDPKHSGISHKQTTNDLQKTTNVPICRGLIHRTEDGWKHCMERLAASKMFSSRELVPPAFQERGEQEKGRASIRHTKVKDDDDEYNHFYYFDGVLKRVQSNFYPHYKRQTNQANTENSVPTVRTKETTPENLLSYIQRLALRKRSERSYAEKPFIFNNNNR